MGTMAYLAQGHKNVLLHSMHCACEVLFLLKTTLCLRLQPISICAPDVLPPTPQGPLCLCGLHVSVTLSTHGSMRLNSLHIVEGVISGVRLWPSNAAPPDCCLHQLQLCFCAREVGLLQRLCMTASSLDLAIPEGARWLLVLVICCPL